MAPGEVLLEDFLKSLGITQHRLAKSIKVPPSRINDVVHGKRSISADLALRLARFFGTDARSWINLQGHCDLERAEIELAARVRKEVKPYPASRNPSNHSRFVCSGAVGSRREQEAQ